MDRPWGLNGPEFLALYGFALIVVCGAMLTARMIVRRIAPTAYPAQLTLYEWAYLHGGETRVAETALAGLIQSRRVRINRTGRLRLAAHREGDEFQELLIDQVSRKNRPSKLCRYLKRSGACMPLLEKLRADGLLIGRTGHVVLRWVWFLFPALAAIALARIVTGIALGHPVGGLIFELVVVVIIGSLTRIQPVSPLRTVKGDRLLRTRTTRISLTTRALSSHDKPEITEQPGPRRLGTTAAKSVAEGGITAYPVKKTARLLKTSSGGGVSGFVGFGGGDGAGSGCGGGGGCGGGCGGGGA